MSPSVAGTTREVEALAEIARTRIATGAARAVVAAFLLLILIGGALELAAAAASRPNLLRGESALDFPRPAELAELWRKQGAIAAASRLMEAGVGAQDRLDRDSQLAAAVRPHLQELLAERLRYGNSQVLIGDDRWLFFRDDFDYLTGPPFLGPVALARRRLGASRHPSTAPDPLPAILALAADLAQHGIGFVVLPVPTKLGVAWERLEGSRAPGGPAIENPSREELLTRLRAANVDVLDPLPLLREMELAGERPYMRFDSHWSPAGLDRVAAALADHLRSRFALETTPGFTRESIAFDRRADLGELLGLDPERNPFLHEPLAIQATNSPDGAPYGTRSSGGQVLLLGDSFSRLLIKNKRRGGDANFAAALAFHLQAPVAMRAENDAGADFARRVRWLRQPHELDNRIVVVFEVAERALALGDWTPERIDRAAAQH